MLPLANLVAFTLAAGLLTITPGLDTALVLRTGIAEGRARGMQAALGIGLGCLCWGIAAGAGLGALLAVSQLAYDLLRWAGAAYLIWLGLGMALRPRTAFDTTLPASDEAGRAWLWRGFVTNLLNPKIGVFYVSFLPQFIPAGSNTLLAAIVLTAIHVVLGLIWFGLLLTAGVPLTERLRRPVTIIWLDRITGLALVGLGLKLALERR